MKKILFALLIVMTSASFSHAQEIIKGVKNSDFLLQKSKKLAQVKFKDGSALLMQNNDDGMNFILVKNGKETPMFNAGKDFTYGQACEFDIDGDGKPEIIIGTRITPSAFTVRIYKKADFEVEYKLFTTINGQDHCEFPGDNTVKIYSDDNKVTHLKFHPDGTWVTLTN